MSEHSRIAEAVASTPWIDTHEHLLEESTRLSSPSPDQRFHPCEDWTYLFLHYAADDLVAAGMSVDLRAELFGGELSATEKWDIFEPYWLRCRNTGYMRAAADSVRLLFNLELNRSSVEAISSAMAELRRPGFYSTVLNEFAMVESCQVNSLESTFCLTATPELLPQDLNIGHLCLPERERLAEWQEVSGRSIATLDDMVAIIDWYFDAYEKRAIAAKLAWAYERPLLVQEGEELAARRAWDLWIGGSESNPSDLIPLQDFLIRHALDRVADARLPLKVHTGYFVGNQRMPLRRVRDNIVDLVPLVIDRPEIDFIVMHTAYPYGLEVIAAAKHFPNVYADLCWAWIIDPVSTEDFVRRFLATAPASKLLCFGGDYMVVENVVGHSAIARAGLTKALRTAVGDGTLGEDDAVRLAPLLMRENARRLMPPAAETAPKSRRR